jgi:hypothetical protein
MYKKRFAVMQYEALMFQGAYDVDATTLACRRNPARVRQQTLKVLKLATGKRNEHNFPITYQNTLKPVPLLDDDGTTLVLPPPTIGSQTIAHLCRCA